MNRSELELMAPVGSFESLMAAIQGGADSVYFGIEQLNMRAKSSFNFTKDDLLEIVDIANENNIKTYLTVNTIIYDNDLALMREVVDLAKSSNVTAIIATDHAVINYAKETGVEVHVSTQVNISNIESLKFYSNWADVVVLARELNLDQVSNIYKEIKEQNVTGPKGKLVRIEMFCHGALCMAISGKCYLSLHEKNYSANRGQCLQTCRKAYTVIEKESGNQLEIDNEYIMSPKDLKTIGFINKMIDAGVRVFKIEGRARSAEYVKTVSQCYNEALNAYIDDKYNEDKIADWDNRLATVFNRGFWDGYYLGQELGEWSHRYGSRATKRKIYIGKCTNYFSKIKVAEIKLESGKLEIGDDIVISGPTTGVVDNKIQEIRFDYKSVDTAKKGETISIPVNDLVRRGDKIYKIVDADKVKQQ